MYDPAALVEYLQSEGLSKPLSIDLADALEGLVHEAHQREGAGYCWLVEQIPTLISILADRHKEEFLQSPVCVEAVIDSTIRTAALGVMLKYDLPVLLGDDPAYTVTVTPRSPNRGRTLPGRMAPGVPGEKVMR